MLFSKIKKLLLNLCTGIVIVFAGIGGYNVYTHFKPVEIVEGQSQIMRLKLESIGKIKVAESERKFKKTITKGGGIFKSNLNIILKYKTNYEYDLNDIEVINEIEDKSVTFLINVEKFIIGDLVLLDDTSYFDNTFIHPTIKEEDVKKYKNDGKNEILKEFKEDREFKDLAIRTLQEKLQQLAVELGFEQIDIITK